MTESKKKHKLMNELEISVLIMRENILFLGKYAPRQGQISPLAQVYLHDGTDDQCVKREGEEVKTGEAPSNKNEEEVEFGGRQGTYGPCAEEEKRRLQKDRRSRRATNGIQGRAEDSVGDIFSAV